MLKSVVAGLAALFVSIAAVHAEDKNYTLTVDGQSFDVAPGDTVHATLKSGANVDIAFSKKEFGVFSENGISFEYPTSLSVSQTDLGHVMQYAVINAVGSMAVLQDYSDLDTANLVPVIFDSLIKQDRAIGATIDMKDNTRKLTDGSSIKGVTATVTHGKDTAFYEVYALNMSGHGAIAFSRVDAYYKGKDQAILDRFWNSLTMK